MKQKYLFRNSIIPEIKVVTVDGISATANRWPLATIGHTHTDHACIQTYVYIFFLSFLSFNETTSWARWMATHICIGMVMVTTV